MSERKLTENQYADLCEAAIENTARRLGVDTVAFAEACEDGEWLEAAIYFAGQYLEGQPGPWNDKLAALKRTEPST